MLTLCYFTWPNPEMEKESASLGEQNNTKHMCIHSQSFVFAILPPKCTLPCAADPGTRIWWAPALYRALGASLGQPEQNLEGRGL